MSRTRGVTTTFDFHPEAMTTRLKNSVVKMLQRRYISGTHGSQSRRVAEIFNDHFELSCGISSWRGIHVSNWDVESMQKDLLEVIETDWAAYALSNSPHHGDWYKRNNEEQRRNILDGVQSFHVSLINQEYQPRLIEVFTKNSLNDENYKAKVKVALAALNGTKSIRIIQLETR
jgi:hypothetical protein